MGNGSSDSRKAVRSDALFQMAWIREADTPRLHNPNRIAMKDGGPACEAVRKSVGYCYFSVLSVLSASAAY